MVESAAWKTIVSLLGAVWILANFVRDKISRDYERNTSVIVRLSEIHKITIDHPDLQKYLCETASQPVAYFRDPARGADLIFIKAKNIVYMDLNLFDELLSFSEPSGKPRSWMSKRWSQFKSWAFKQNLVERENWETYIKCKLRHPFYNSTLEKEAPIFGNSLINFWKTHRDEILNDPIDILLW
jgi:hypothetical protein